ncbi:MAG: DUF3023 domain-containing protein [Ehrlichia sp.]
MYCIGNTESGSQYATVCADATYRKGEQQIIPKGRSLFLLKCDLPDAVVEYCVKRKSVAKNVKGYIL